VVAGARRCVFAAVVAVGTVLALADDARASTTARLVYLRGTGSESCPDEGELRDAVAARLGYDPFTPFALETLFTEVDKEANGFVARVKLVSHENTVRGARTLQTTGPCSDLMASLALTISIAIDPMAGTRKGAPEGLPPRERDVEPAPTSPRTEEAPIEDAPGAAAPEPAAPPSPRVQLAIGAGTLGSIGYAPGPAVGFAVFGRARLGDLGLAIEGRADLPAGADARGGGRVESSLLAVSLLPCGHAGVVFGCIRGSLGRLQARGVDVTDPGSTGVLWGAVGVRGGAELPLGGVFALRVHVDGDALVTRYTLRIGGITRFRYPAVAGAIGLAFAATFP
jgi:hypothetical protein